MKAIKDIPAISVILSVYNGGEYLKASIRSVLQQSFTDFEFLVNDDFSTDGSWEYLQSIHDERLKIYRQDRNRGLFPCLNELIGRSSAPLIKLWSQDDIMKPECLDTIWNFHQKHPAIGFSYSEKDIIDEFGRTLPTRYIDHTPEILSSEEHARIALYTGSIAGNIANVCITRAALNKVGNFHEEMKISADFDMWVRIARYFNIGFIRQKIVQLRDHKKQLSRNKRYFIRRPIEDLEVFTYLLSYTDENIKKEGLANLRKYKLVYYYTLMVKAALAGNIKTAIRFQQQLVKFAPFHKLTYSFVKWKLLKPPAPSFIALEHIAPDHEASLAEKSFVLVKFPKWGLGNLMLIWAKAYVFAHINKLPLLVSHWWGLRPGAILRNERTMRLYWNQFRETPTHKLLMGRLRAKLTTKIIEPPVTLLPSKESTAAVYLFNELTLKTNPFKDLWDHRIILKNAIHEMLTDPIRETVIQYPSPVIGVHIRRGDFKKGSTLTPLDVFQQIIELIREAEGTAVPVHIFSDGSDEELQPVLALPNTQRAASNVEIVDILGLSKSKYLVLSYGSTFGYWAAFLSNATVIRPKDWIERIAPDRSEGYKEIVYQMDQPLDKQLLKNALTAKATNKNVSNI